MLFPRLEDIISDCVGETIQFQKRSNSFLIYTLSLSHFIFLLYFSLQFLPFHLFFFLYNFTSLPPSISFLTFHHYFPHLVFNTILSLYFTPLPTFSFYFISLISNSTFSVQFQSRLARFTFLLHLCFQSLSIFSLIFSCLFNYDI